MWNIWILGLTSLLTDISTEMVYPLLPLFLTSRLGATPAIVGLIEGIAESLASLLKVFAGRISDKWGKRKPLAIGGYAFSTFGKVFLYFGNSWVWVLTARVLDRFGKGVRTAPRDALIAESANPVKKGRAFGLHRTLDTLGAVIGILIAYYLFTKEGLNYKTIFLASLIPAFLGVGALFAVKEESTSRARMAKDISFNWRSLSPRLQGFLLVAFLFTLGNSSNQFLLLRAKDVGFTDRSVILLYLVFNLVYSFLSYPAGRLSDRIGRRALLVCGYIAYGLVYLGFARVTTMTGVWCLFALYGVYNAFTEGVEKALVADLAPADQKATLIGLHATLVGIGLLPASLFAGLLWNWFGPAAPFYFGGVSGLLAALGLFFILRQH